jgi:hypothetical protein
MEDREMKMTIDQVRANVADGAELAALMGKYNTPGGTAEITIEKESAGWDVVQIVMTIGEKRIMIPQDILERHIAAGRMTKIEG